MASLSFLGVTWDLGAEFVLPRKYWLFCFALGSFLSLFRWMELQQIELIIHAHLDTGLGIILGCDCVVLHFHAVQKGGNWHFSNDNGLPRNR